jgi:hypothetical protein
MKKLLTRKFLIILLGVCAIFGTCKFEYDSRSSGFVPVESITGVPTGGVKGYEFTLSRSVEPETATNKAIVWSIAEDGGTNAILDRNKLTATSTGTVTVRAVIKDGKAPGEDYTQEFDITVHEEYIAVNAIQGIPAKISIGTFKLEGTVRPDDAVNKTITWEIKSAGTTGALLNGDVLTVSTWGMLTVTAIVEKGAGPDTDFRQDFEITVAPISVTSITGVTTKCVMGDYTLFGIVSPMNATFKNITWQLKEAGRTVAVINGDTLRTTSVSETYPSQAMVRVTAVVKDGIDFGYDYIQDFDIEILEYYNPVEEIYDLPTECRVGDYVYLSGVVSPDHATYYNIIWELVSAGETGAYIEAGRWVVTPRTGTVTINAIVKGGTTQGDYPDGKYTIEDYRQEFTMTITPR